MMRRFFYFLALLPLIARTQEEANNNTQTEAVQWIDNLSWSEIMKKAAAENKFVFVDVYTTWCGPCKQMDAKVYPDQAVAKVLNENFLSVKIQMDETDKDNEKIKARYVDARYINNNYRPEGYPSFLFFAPDGTLANQVVGYREPDKFIAVVYEALANPMDKYKIEVEKFKNGQLAYIAMPELARQARRNKDEVLADNIAKVYKEKYLDLLNTERAFTKENLLFVFEFYNILVTTKDKFFKFFYQQGGEADKLMNHPDGNVSDWVVTDIIRKEEITDKLYKEDKPILNLKPNWVEIQASIAKKYGKVIASQYFPEEQIQFYKDKGDCKNYVKYVNQKIRMIPPQAFGHLFWNQFGDSWGLNGYAWGLFKFCMNKQLLKTGLQWSEESIRLRLQEKKDSSLAVQYFDTRANLLYRLGKRQQAIEQEQIALSLAAPGGALKKEFTQVIEKMKKGLPTWPEANY
jgi:thioredoxin-related protein